ncbi:TPA: N-formylglutamate amidohydrolase, partial [Klebsiella pneumoniae]
IPRLFDGRLPDLNLGTNGGASCAAALSDRLVDCCQKQSPFSHVLNGRFKGGYITRAYGQPDANIHAVQLELAQVNYMNEMAPYAYAEEKAPQLQALLRSLLENMLDWADSHYQ